MLHTKYLNIAFNLSSAHQCRPEVNHTHESRIDFPDIASIEKRKRSSIVFFRLPAEIRLILASAHTLSQEEGGTVSMDQFPSIVGLLYHIFVLRKTHYIRFKCSKCHPTLTHFHIFLQNNLISSCKHVCSVPVFFFHFKTC